MTSVRYALQILQCHLLNLYGYDNSTPLLNAKPTILRDRSHEIWLHCVAYEQLADDESRDLKD